MASRIQDFGRIVKQLIRAGKTLSFGLIGVMVFLLAFRVADLTTALSRVHPMLGVAFLLALALLLAILVGRPLVRFLRIPAVMRPPRLPPVAERTPRHLVRHLEYVERYVRALPDNPAWEGDVRQIEEAVRQIQALRDDVRGVSSEELKALPPRVARLEQETVQRLLAPLDRKAADTIRSEAYRVGIATAVSPYGTLDAFLVLWRNCNLVARIATIYYGRPSPRGTLQVLRDVSVATIAGAYLQDLGEVAGEFMGALAGKTAGFFAGPLMEGCLNGVATLRVGYLAKGRCRAFQAWTEKTAAQAARAALVESGHFAAGLVGDLVRTVGGGLLRIPAKMLGGLADRLAGIFRGPRPATDPTS